MKPHRDKAIFWYQVWLSADKPRVGQLFNIMRHNRNQFRYARRKCLRAVEYIKREKFIAASLEGEKDLFEELRKMKQAGKAGPSKVMVSQVWIVLLITLVLFIRTSTIKTR